MTPLELIQQELNNANLNEVIDYIYENIKIAKSPRSRIVFLKKSLLPKEEIATYLQDILKANDPYNLKNDKRRYEEFLEYLCEVLNISTLDYEIFMEACREMKRRYDVLEQPYIYVDTHFKRKGEPVIALAMMEGRRRIMIDKENYLNRSEEENLRTVAYTVKLHYKWRGGKLALWGKIRGYLYYDGQGKRTVFDCLGDIIEDDIYESKASIKLGNKTLI